MLAGAGSGAATRASMNFPAAPGCFIAAVGRRSFEEW
jgi:hypothetical protein